MNVDDDDDDVGEGGISVSVDDKMELRDIKC